MVPRYGRVVVWQSAIPYLPRPPSVAYKLGQLFLHIRFTKNQTKFKSVHEKWLEQEQVRETIRNEGFFQKAVKEQQQKGQFDVESKLVSEAKSKEGKRILVFDDLFTKDVLDYLRNVILNYGVYYYDDSYDEESDNVQWIAAFDVDKYVQSRMWGITREVCSSDMHVSMVWCFDQEAPHRSFHVYPLPSLSCLLHFPQESSLNVISPLLYFAYYLSLISIKNRCSDGNHGKLSIGKRDHWVEMSKV